MNGRRYQARARLVGRIVKNALQRQPRIRITPGQAAHIRRITRKGTTDA